MRGAASGRPASATRHLRFVRQQQLIELVAPGTDLRKRLRLPLVAELGRLRSDNLPHDLPGQSQLTADRQGAFTDEAVRYKGVRNRNRLVRYFG